MISVFSGLLLWSLIGAIGFGIAQWRQRVFVERKLEETLLLLDQSMRLTDALVAHVQARATLDADSVEAQVVSIRAYSDRIH